MMGIFNRKKKNNHIMKKFQYELDMGLFHILEIDNTKYCFFNVNKYIKTFAKLLNDSEYIHLTNGLTGDFLTEGITICVTNKTYWFFNGYHDKLGLLLFSKTNMYDKLTVSLKDYYHNEIPDYVKKYRRTLTQKLERKLSKNGSRKNRSNG